MEKAKLERLSELTRISRERELTDKEKRRTSKSSETNTAKVL